MQNKSFGIVNRTSQFVTYIAKSVLLNVKSSRNVKRQEDCSRFFFYNFKEKSNGINKYRNNALWVAKNYSTIAVGPILS